MFVTFQALVFLTLSGLVLSVSDHVSEGFLREPESIFSGAIKPLEHCHTSLGEHGKCIPLNDCPNLRQYAEGRNKKRIVSVINHFGCGFQKVLFVCCTEMDIIKPFEGLSHLLPDKHETHHDYNDPDAPFLVAHSDGFLNGRPERKDSSEESHNLEDLPDGKVPGWQGTSAGLSSTGSGSQVAIGQQQYLGGHFSTGSIIPDFGSSYPNSQGFFSNNRPNNEESFGDRPTSGSAFGKPSSIGGDRPLPQGVSASIYRPTDQGFGNGRPSESGLGNQGPQQFSSSANERPSQGSFGRPVNQGFSNSRPGIQSFGNERPFGEGFENERPSNQAFGNNRPGIQSFGNERPFGEFESERPGDTGINRPNNYEVYENRPNKDNNRPSSGRPGSKRPTNQGSYNEQDSYGSSSFINGETNNQRPNNNRPNNTQGSKKRPSNSGSYGKHPSRRLLPDGNCGTEISDKIIGGDNTNIDEFPWMALLHFSTKNGRDRGYGCGGSLINERYVLTAAHCIKGPSLPSNTIINTVRLGEYDITKKEDCMNGVCSPSPIDAAVEEIIVHPDYKPSDRAQHHDIALIRLRKKVPFSTYVSPICLPGDELKRKDYSGKQLTVAGWGKTANGGRVFYSTKEKANGQSSSIKQKVSLPFVTLENCKPFYEGINIRLRNTQMCAGGEKEKDSCQGDSGGPLMSNELVNGQSSWYVTGIVSFGPEDCGIKNIAGVYTKVSEYVDWILDNMKE